jgi:hypothetical protein
MHVNAYRAQGPAKAQPRLSQGSAICHHLLHMDSNVLAGRPSLLARAPAPASHHCQPCNSQHQHSQHQRLRSAPSPAHAAVQLQEATTPVMRSKLCTTCMVAPWQVLGRTPAKTAGMCTT